MIESLDFFGRKDSVTAEEKDRIQQMAADEDMNVSDFIRDRIGL